VPVPRHRWGTGDLSLKGRNEAIFELEDGTKRRNDFKENKVLEHTELKPSLKNVKK
jgi:hypothetical protein